MKSSLFSLQDRVRQTEKDEKLEQEEKQLMNSEEKIMQFSSFSLFLRVWGLLKCGEHLQIPKATTTMEILEFLF